MPELGYELMPSFGGQSWSIIDKNVEPVPGMLITNLGLVGYLTAHNKLNFNYSPREDRSKDWDNVVDFTKGPKQAARFVWLQRQQPIAKPVQTSASELKELRTPDDDKPEHFRKVVSNDVKGWFANVIRDNPHTTRTGGRGIHTNAAYIYNKDLYIGAITYDGGYRLVGSFDEYERGKFNPTDDNSIRQAIRFMFLMTQKPIAKNRK